MDQLRIIVPLVILILGAIFYRLAKSGDTKEMGRIAFAIGLLLTGLAFVLGLYHR